MLLDNSSAATSVAERNPKTDARIADLGFVHWETSWNRPSLSNRYFEVFLARPRGTATSFSFLLKALRPEYCGSLLGVALVERERAIGSIDCRHILPIVDYKYPKRVSTTQAERGYLVFPYFKGRTLEKNIRHDVYYSDREFERFHRQLLVLGGALAKRGWAARMISPNQLLVISNEAENDPQEAAALMLFDFSDAYRFSSPSLFTENYSARPSDPSFDPTYQLPPNVFFNAELNSTSTQYAVNDLIDRLILL